MLDAYIIEELKRQQEERRRDDDRRPALELPVAEDEETDEKPHPEDEDPSVIIIDYNA